MTEYEAKLRVALEAAAESLGEIARDCWCDVNPRGIARSAERAEVLAREALTLPETKCYCVCHFRFASRSSCEHCKGINAVSDFHLKKRIAELESQLKDIEAKGSKNGN